MYPRALSRPLKQSWFKGRCQYATWSGPSIVLTLAEPAGACSRPGDRQLHYIGLRFHRRTQACM